jgi:hypothetical protein
LTADGALLRSLFKGLRCQTAPKARIGTIRVSSALSNCDASSVVQCNAAWPLGNVLNEIEDREQITEEDYEREWQQTYDHVMARLDEQRCESRGASR